MCPKCLDRKHVLENGKWVPCICQKIRTLKSTFEQAGISKEIWDRRKEREISRSFKLARKQISKGKILFIVGDNLQKRWCIASLLLRDCIFAGLMVYTIRLHHLIDAIFDRDSQIQKDVTRCFCLWIKMDYARQHKWNEPVLHDLLSSRINKVTLITSKTTIPINEKYSVI